MFLTENLSLADTRLSSVARICVEAIALNDALEREWHAERTHVENISMLDDSVASWLRYLSFTEGILLNDIAEVRKIIQKYFETYTEYVSFSDAVQFSAARFFSEQLALDHVFARTWTIYRELLEQVLLSDSSIAICGWFPVFTEHVSFRDSVFPEWIQGLITQLLTEHLALGHSKATFNIHKVVMEELGLADLVSKYFTFTLTDGFVLADSSVQRRLLAAYIAMELEVLDLMNIDIVALGKINLMNIQGSCVNLLNINLSVVPHDKT